MTPSSPVPNAIYSENYFSKHCVLVRNPQRDYKDKIQDLNIPCIAKVKFNISNPKC